jgi:two-component system, OmpR family, phosphate regulon sensor histidine kinase PhoR
VDKDVEIEQLKNQISQLKAEITRINKEKDEYLQNVAHQITAPLNNLKWNIEALEDPEVPIQRKQVLLRSIYSQTTILVHLIKNFALMSALETEHSLESFREKASTLDPKLLMINLSNDFQPQARSAGITVEVDDATFDRFSERKRNVIAIKNLIDQVLSNILANGIKYANKGTRILSSLRLEGDFVVISISSQGLPIDEEDKKKIFERGFRGKGAKERLPAGTGFGLYIAQKIMELHSGRIEVKPNGNMTVFDVWLPHAK